MWKCRLPLQKLSLARVKEAATAAGGVGRRGREGSVSSLSQCSPAAVREERPCSDEPPPCFPDCPPAGSGRGAQCGRWLLFSPWG
ncbi:hypothetical protein R6Z07F_005990 [Ovis aries]